MDFLLLFSVLLFFLRTVFAHQNQGHKPIYESLVKSSLFRTPFRQQLLRPKRSTPHKITECLFVTSEENFYYFKSEKDSDEVCGVYLFAGPDEVIEVHFEHLNVPCETGSLIAFFDGWELSGKFFPEIKGNEKDFRERYEEFCGFEKAKRVFLTSQNAGMLHYRTPVKGKGFSFYVKFIKNPAPCNILVESKDYFYTLRNHGKANNCTLLAVFPAKIQLLAIDVGVPTSDAETGFVNQCGEKNLSDKLEIGGCDDLDSSQVTVFEDFCGLNSLPGMYEMVIGCEVSVVKLASSGLYDNSATFRISQPEQEELFESRYICKL